MTRFQKDGPRERLLRLGPGALNDEELVAAILGTGSREWPVEHLACALLEELGGTRGLVREPAAQLATRHGLGPARAVRLLAGVELGRRAQETPDTRPRLGTSREVYAYLAPRLSGLRREVFHVLALSARNVLLRDVRVAEGSVDSCPVDPREVFSVALTAGATSVVLAHNHPSGDPEPSELDIALTASLARGAQLLHLSVLDHIVVGDGAYVSLQERGLLASNPALGLPARHRLRPAR